MQLYQVTEVIDGDTFKIDPPIPRRVALQTPIQRLRGETLAETPMQRLERPNTFKKIRLANINAPEIDTPQGERAMLYLKGLLEGKRVTLKPIGVSSDSVVADVWRYPNQVFVNAIMVYSGYAEWAQVTSNGQKIPTSYDLENVMNYLNELPNLIADRVKVSLGPEKLLKIDSDKLFRSIVLDAAGQVTGVILNRIRDGNNIYNNLPDTAILPDVMSVVSKKLFEKALEESTISQAISILKEEQKFLGNKQGRKINV